MSGYEFLEHTADVGIRASGDSLTEAFEQAGIGLAELLGTWFPGEGDERVVEVEAPDREALLAAWIDELVWLHESEGVVFGGFEVARVGGDRLQARIRLAPIGQREIDGVGVKAATYHRLSVETGDRESVVEVFVDV